MPQLRIGTYHRYAISCLALLMPLRAAMPQLAAQQAMIRLELHGQPVEGTVLSWNPGAVCLLARDGRLWEFAPREAENFRQTAAAFRAYSPQEIRIALLQQYGRQFDVTGKGNYLVVHPLGEKDRWAARFDALHRSFQHYFTARGIRPAASPFPLVAVVHPDWESFRRAAAVQGVRVPRQVLGFYSLRSNHVLMYDLARGPEGGFWEENAETIIHEALHQVAFNTGIHSRHAPPPQWVVEGLATMFEAPGVWNSLQHKSLAQRLNRQQLDQFLRQLGQRQRGTLENQVASDDLFQRDPAAAYAEAWALTFFLAETDGRRYVDYLARTAQLAPFPEPDDVTRRRTFTEVFGPDPAALEARMLRYYRDLAKQLPLR